MLCPTSSPTPNRFDQSIKNQDGNRVLSKCFRACLQGGGGPKVGGVTRLGGVTLPSINVSFSFDDVYMIVGVTSHMLSHLHVPGSPASM